MSLHLLTDRAEALDGLLGAAGAGLSRRVRSADCDEERVAAVEAELCRGRETSTPPPLRAALRTISRRRGALRAGELRGLGLCDRQLRRVFRDAVGIGPKALCRIVRLRSAFAAHQAGVTWAEAALRAGFCDQAHLAREARSLLGAPPTALEERSPLAAVFGVAAGLDPAV
jgi:methylphosphotriester-DNA--protein-cysteine methyltransferase